MAFEAWLLLKKVVGEFQTEKNSCGVARFPCDSTAVLFFFKFPLSTRGTFDV